MFKGHTVYRLSVSLENPFIYDDVILQPRPESFSFFPFMVILASFNVQMKAKLEGFW